MGEQNEEDAILHESERIYSCVSPRVIILDREGNFPLVPFRDTEWLGLPGGKVKQREAGGNYLSVGAFPGAGTL